MWEASSVRPDPVGLLEQQAETRVPELVPIRHGRMLVSPFTFFRGAALLMAADLASTPRSGIPVQLCGDAHLSNFGVFGTPERKLVFDINDFDETLPGPWEWDVKRLAASFVVAGRDRGLSAEQRRTVALACLSTYRTAMGEFAAMSNLEVWYAHLNIEQTLEEFRGELTEKQVANTEARIAKARTKDSMRAFDKLTHIVDGERRIISDPPLIVPFEELFGIDWQEAETELRALMRDYRSTLSTERRWLLEQYNLAHFARKVVGVGSVGTRAWIGLFLGRDDVDPLFLQVKEAQPSVLEPFLGRSEYSNSGQRVVAGQRLMQAASDLFLGHSQALDFQAYVRQLADMKGSIDPAKIPPAALSSYIARCGEVLARAHARSGDPAAISGYLGKDSLVFDQAIVEYADRVSIQNELDHAELVQAVADGTVPVFTP